MSEKIEAFWENATADDVARVMTGETVEARFRDDGLPLWSHQRLSGWQTTGVRPLWHSGDGFVWARCQVYREPSWWAKRPDPGLGYTLVGKFPHQNLRPGDERFATNGKWVASTYAKIGAGQAFDVWYRRRIEPVEPEPKHYVLRVGDSVETPRGHLINVVSSSAEQRIYSLDAGDRLTLPNGQTITITAKGFEVTQ